MYSHFYRFILSLLLLSTTLTAQVVPIHRISHTRDPSQISSSAFSKLYAVTATLDSHDDSATSSKSSVNMLLGLYTSTTLFSKGCIGFDEYELPISSSDNKSRTYSFLNFNAMGPRLETDLSLDSDYWSLNGLSVLAEKCSSKSNADFENIGLAGIIGMGFFNTSLNNYLHDSTIFSIYLYKDGNAGQLAFMNDVSLVQSVFPVAVLTASPNLHVYNVTSISVSNGASRNVDLSIGKDDYYSIIFDLNIDAIGLPETVFSDIMEALDQLVDNLDCSGESYRPECSFNGNLEDLPTININISGATIPVVPEIYVVNASSYENGTIDGKLTLNLKAVSKQANNENYVERVFNSSIILDSAFMTYYYTVFNTDTFLETTNITLYLANHNPSVVMNSNEQPSKVQVTYDHALHYALFSVLLVLLLAAGAYYFFVRRSRAKSQVDEEDAGEVSMSSYARQGRGVSLLSQSQL